MAVQGGLYKIGGAKTLFQPIILLKQLWPLSLRTCMKTECVISGTTGELMHPNYCYKISWSLTRLIIKLAGQTYKSTFFSAVDDTFLYYIVSLAFTSKSGQCCYVEIRGWKSVSAPVNFVYDSLGCYILPNRKKKGDTAILYVICIVLYQHKRSNSKHPARYRKQLQVLWPRSYHNIDFFLEFSCVQAGRPRLNYGSGHWCLTQIISN